MSTDTRVVIYCDGPECIESPISEASYNAAKSRALARQVGWHRTSSPFAKDVCPDCWKAGVR